MRPLSHRIYLLGQALSTTADRLLRSEFDLGFTDYLVLHGVGNKRLTSQADLPGFVGLSDAGVSRIVTRLVSRGLIESREDPANRRRSVLALTEKGAHLLQRSSQHLERRFGRGAGQIASPEDMAAFERVLDAILTKMEPKQ